MPLRSQVLVSIVPRVIPTQRLHQAFVPHPQVMINPGITTMSTSMNMNTAMNINVSNMVIIMNHTMMMGTRPGHQALIRHSLLPILFPIASL